MGSGSSPEDVIHRVAALLDASEIPYMLTGSFASGLYGHPRATQDLDFVISPTLGSLARFVDELPSNAYYVDRQTALEAYGNETLFNLIEVSSGWKIDLICRKGRAFSVAEFERRSLREIGGVPVYVASVEDSILSKLEWARLSQSERQLEDVAGMLRLQSNLDTAYIERWAAQLGILAQWAAAKVK